MSHTLSEADSAALLAGHGVPIAPERLVAGPEEAAVAAEEIGFPVVAKLCGDHLAHKTERGLVRLGLRDRAAVAAATTALLAAGRPEDGVTGVLVAPMLAGSREFIAGLATDPQFGRTVLLGVGGVLAEAVADVAVRLVPITRVDAEEMIEELSSQALLGEFRGEPAVDRDALVAVLVGLSDAAVAEPAIVSADLNPLIVHEGRPVAVDALVELGDDAGAAA
ncbi:MAG: acetate--CoA ligase family protein [Microthrixaceae bacterium]